MTRPWSICSRRQSAAASAWVNPPYTVLYIDSATKYVDWLIDNVKAAAESWKSVPYYASLQTVGINHTLGGLVIDTTGRVYNGDNLPIFGLYACSGATFSCEGVREAVKNALCK